MDDQFIIDPQMHGLRTWSLVVLTDIAIIVIILRGPMAFTCYFIPFFRSIGETCVSKPSIEPFFGSLPSLLTLEYATPGGRSINVPTRDLSHILR